MIIIIIYISYSQVNYALKPAGRHTKKIGLKTDRNALK